MSLRQIFTVGALKLIQIRDGIQAQSIHAQIKPEIHGGKHCFAHLWIFPVEVWLVGIKTMPIIRPGNWVPGPVGGFKVLEDDARVTIFVRRVTPDIKISPAASCRRAARALKPEVLV